MEMLDKIMNNKLLNYERLNHLFKPFINKYKKESTIDIFIDVWDWIKPLYNPNVTDSLNSLTNNDRYTISSHLINIISHYRHYFASRYEMYTNFYFILSTGRAKDIIKIFPEYKKDFYEKRIDENSYFKIFNDILKINFNISKNFIKYVPHAYWIDTKSYSPLGMYSYIINNDDNHNNLKIIISNDDYLLSLCVKNNDVLILQSRSEKSKIYYSDNVFSYFSDDEDSILDNKYIPYILILSSNKNYNIKGIRNMGYKRAIKFLKKEFINLLGDEGNVEMNNRRIFLPEYQMNEFYSIYCKLFEINLIDNIDIEGVRQVNNQFFIKNPVLLDFCFEGEEYM